MNKQFCSRERLQNLCVSLSATLHEALRTIQEGTKQIALVVDDHSRLKGTVTDGDIRRALLAGTSSTAPIDQIMQRAFTSGKSGLTTNELYQVMRANSIRHLPILESDGTLVDLVWISDLLADKPEELSAVIMAGGFGTRLFPLTNDLPKPMLPIGDKPLLEILIGQLKQSGVKNVSITTHYLPEKIEGYFGDGQAFGVDLRYVSEDSPLGTAGALSLLQSPDKPLLVINGDILTRVDFRAMFDFHRDSKAELTVAVRPFEVKLPYGIVECDGAYIQSLREKPTLSFFVNAGIYLLEPSLLQRIPKGRRYDMTDLIDQLIGEQRAVASFPIQEYWLDIGQHADYQRAQEDLKLGLLSPRLQEDLNAAS